MSDRLPPAEIEALLGAYALDAVDDDEREQVELALHDHPEWRDEVAGHLEVAALLAHTGSSAPAGLWSRIAESLEEAPPALRLAVVPPDGGPVAPVAPTDVVDGTPSVTPIAAARGARLPRGAWALAAVAATVIVFLGIVAVRQEQRLDRQEQELLSPTVDELAAEALADPDSIETVLVSGDGSLASKAVLGEDGTGFLLGEDLPALPDDRSYQLWGVTDGGAVISLGVFGSDPGVATFHVDGTLTALALTEEVEGGVVVSANDPVVAGEIEA